MAFEIRLVFVCVLSLFANLAIISSARNILPLSGNRNLLGAEMEMERSSSLKVGIDDFGSSIRSNSLSSQKKISSSANRALMAAKENEVVVLDYSEPKPNPGHDPRIPPPATSK